MEQLDRIAQKEERLVVGLMSGTSADGVDAALVEISGCGTGTRARLSAFVSVPFSPQVRTRVLRVANGEFGGAAEVCRMNFLLGELLADACEAVCRQAGVRPDLIGSHGQTIHHLPEAEDYLGHRVRSTLQIGEASVLCERFGCPVVSDFRVRDMAAGGLGAPLVPYTEYLLYRDAARTVGLQNIGGIGNITVLPAGCALEEVYAFDTGPGNMVMDALAELITGGRERCDVGGCIALKGRVNERLLARLIEEDDYLRVPPPKTTGREHYGPAYVSRLLQHAEDLGCRMEDTLATATRYTAEAIAVGIRQFCPHTLQRLIVGGGGSHNRALMRDIAACLPGCEVITNEALGLDSDAKEAVAFAVLANEALFGVCNNAPAATGADHPVVMGKISL